MWLFRGRRGEAQGTSSTKLNAGIKQICTTNSRMKALLEQRTTKNNDNGKGGKAHKGQSLDSIVNYCNCRRTEDNHNPFRDFFHFHWVHENRSTKPLARKKWHEEPVETIYFTIIGLLREQTEETSWKGKTLQKNSLSLPNIIPQLL